MDHSERHIRVPRTARYSVLGDPATASEIWFVVHGYGQLAGEFIRRFEALPGIGSRRAVVAPEALSRFYVEREIGAHGSETRVGASWMTREDRQHEIRDYVEYLDRVAETVLGDAVGDEGGGGVGVAAGAREAGAEARLVVLGFSQGSETASRWVVSGRIRPAELVLWGGGLAEDLEPGPAREALRRMEVRLVVGSGDAWGGRRSKQTEARLEEWDLRGERIGFEGGHRISGEVLASHWP